LGYGAALQSGFKFAEMKKYPYILQFDADGQHNPMDLVLIMDELVKGVDDIVIGSRFLGDPNFNPGLFKKAAITCFRWIISSLTHTKITDPTSGLRGLNRNIFSFYSIRDRFPADFPDADIMIQMILNGFKVKEVPISSRARTEGESMHSGIKPFVYILKISLSILIIMLRNKMEGRAKKHG
jgi:glycosyltransferase involved in cell wall biosynthesis